MNPNLKTVCGLPGCPALIPLTSDFCPDHLYAPILYKISDQLDKMLDALEELEYQSRVKDNPNVIRRSRALRGKDDPH